MDASIWSVDVREQNNSKELVNVRKAQRLAATMVGIFLLVGTAACSGDSSSDEDKNKKKPSSTASGPASQLPLAPPNAIGPQPAQINPNELPPNTACNVLRESGAMNATSPLKDTSEYKLQFVNGGWCTYGPKGGARKAPIFSILYEGRKGDKQVRINYGDATYTAGERFGRDYPGQRPAVEPILLLNADEELSVLLSVSGSSKPRRYVGTVVTTRAVPAMTMLLYFSDPRTRSEAVALAHNAAASAFRAGQELQ